MTMAVANGHVALYNISFVLEHLGWMNRALQASIPGENPYTILSGVAHNYGIHSFEESRSGFGSLCVQLKPHFSNILLARAHTMSDKNVKEHRRTLTAMKSLAKAEVVSVDASEIAMLAAAAVQKDLFPDDEPALKHIARSMSALTDIFSLDWEARQLPNSQSIEPALNALRALGVTITDDNLMSIKDTEALWRFFPEAQMLLHTRLAHILENQRDNGVRNALFGINTSLIEKAREAGIIEETFYVGAMVMLEYGEYGNWTQIT